MRVLFCPTSFVRTKLSNLETDLGGCLHFSYGPLRAKESYLIQTFPRPFHRADDHHPTFIMLVFIFLVWKSEVFLSTSSWTPNCMSSIQESISGDNTLQSLFIQQKWVSLSPRNFKELTEEDLKCWRCSKCWPRSSILYEIKYCGRPTDIFL